MVHKHGSGLVGMVTNWLFVCFVVVYPGLILLGICIHSISRQVTFGSSMMTSLELGR